MTKAALAKGKSEEKQLKSSTKSEESNFKQHLQDELAKYTVELDDDRKELSLEEIHHEKEKEQAINSYQVSLLALYKESDRLQNILKTQDEKMTKERNHH